MVKLIKSKRPSQIWPNYQMKSGQKAEFLERMRPMSLWESGDSSGEVSLRELFEGKDPIGGMSNLDLEGVAFVACRGGWPLAVEHGC